MSPQYRPFGVADREVYLPFGTGSAKYAPFGGYEEPEEEKDYNPLNIPAQSDNTEFNIYHGRRGAGKSFTLVQKAWEQKARLAMRPDLNYFRLVGNFQCALFDQSDDEMVREFLTFSESIANLFAYVDELHGWSLARASMTRQNKDFNYFQTMVRKRRVNLEAATQFPQVLDGQTLLQIDNTVRVVSNKSKTWFKYEWYDFWGSEVDKQYRRLHMPPGPWEGEPDCVEYFHCGNPSAIYGLFYSYQVLATANMPKEAIEALRGIEGKRLGMDDPDIARANASDLDDETADEFGSEKPERQHRVMMTREEIENDPYGMMGRPSFPIWSFIEAESKRLGRKASYKECKDRLASDGCSFETIEGPGQDGKKTRTLMVYRKE